MESEIGNRFGFTWKHGMIDFDHRLEQPGGEDAVLPGIIEFRITGDHSLVAFNLPLHIDGERAGGMLINDVNTKKKNEDRPQPGFHLCRFQNCYKKTLEFKRIRGHTQVQNSVFRVPSSRSGCRVWGLEFRFRHN